MKKINKILSIVLCIVVIVCCFAGCSSKSTTADEITNETMLIAYTEENAPFIYIEDGKLTGFDVEIIEKIFDSIKNDYKNYKFVKVEADYKVGEDTAYTDKQGNEYVASIMIGGIKKDNGSFNKNHSFTQDIINNRIIAFSALGNKIATYADLQDKAVGVVTKQAMESLDKHSKIKDGVKSVKEYNDIKSAIKDLDAGKIDAVVTDEFSYNTIDTEIKYTLLTGELDNISYVYSFKKYDDNADAVNEAILELKSEDYNGSDEFTPIVKKYFGYNASSFEYTPIDK